MAEYLDKTISLEEFKDIVDSSLKDIINKWDIILEKCKIIRQIENITNHNIRNKFYQLVINKMDKFYNDIILLKNRWKQIEKLKIWISEFTGFIFEAYLVGRILRDFEKGISPSKIIVYAGNDHIKRIINMLDELEFIKHDERISRSFPQGTTTQLYNFHKKDELTHEEKIEKFHYQHFQCIPYYSNYLVFK